MSLCLSVTMFAVNSITAHLSLFMWNTVLPLATVTGKMKLWYLVCLYIKCFIHNRECTPKPLVLEGYNQNVINFDLKFRFKKKY